MVSPLDWLLGLFSLDIGIDLGTANTLVSVRGKGIVINEPSYVAIERKTRRPISVGREAKEMFGKTPTSKYMVVRPLRDGVIGEFEITEAMLDYFIRKAHEQNWVPIRVRASWWASFRRHRSRSAPSTTRRSAPARAEAFLIEEPVAAAIGAGLPIQETRGSMVVDIGGGTTEVAIFSLGGIVISRSIRVAGDEMDEDIVQYMRAKYNMLIGERTAERAKIEIGSAYPLPEERTMVMRGRNLVNGLPEAVEVSSIELREALNPSVGIVIDTIRDALTRRRPNWSPI